MVIKSLNQFSGVEILNAYWIRSDITNLLLFDTCNKIIKDFKEDRLKLFGKPHITKI
jgi:hypothetical protein